MLRRFYAVTTSGEGHSLYLVESKDKDTGRPFFQKLALYGDSGIALGTKVINEGTRISIEKELYIYTPDPQFTRRPGFPFPEEVHSKTSCVIALFTTKKDAEKCFDVIKIPVGRRIPQTCALCEEWRRNSIEVLELIGDNHPAFEISKWEDCIFVP